MPSDTNTLQFFEALKLAYENKSFKKLLLSKSVNSSINRIQIKLIEIKKEIKFSFVYEYPTKNLTKNYEISEAQHELNALMPLQFKNAVLYTSENDIRLAFGKKFKTQLFYSKPSAISDVSLSHDRKKKRVVDVEGNVYLQKLGVATPEGKLVQGMQDKYKQINKFIETIDGVLSSSLLYQKEQINVVDMGSGKGYLTFALYDFLNNNCKIETHISGVEAREELVSLCNKVARDCAYENLNFYKDEINSFLLPPTDVLVALHACDTATDDAIFKGISSGVQVIITAPCCHKQIRPEININNIFNDILKYGIFKERMAETITDAMRGLILEAYGYKVHIFEFIADAHTHKNVMITAVKQTDANKKAYFIDKIEGLKKIFGIKNFYLQNLCRD